MAIQKTITQPNSVGVSYWRIIQTTRNYDRKEIVIDLAGYVSEEARKVGAVPVTSMQILKPLEGLTETRDEVYTLIKEPIEQPEASVDFSDAVDLKV